MRNLEKRLAEIEAQVDAILPLQPSPAEQAAAAAAWNDMVVAWSERLLSSMGLPTHYQLVNHWTLHVLRQCTEKQCSIVPPGLLDHLWKLWAFKSDESRLNAVGLPPAVVEQYLAGDAHDQLNMRPHGNCELCGTPVPVAYFFVQGRMRWPFETCPLDGCGGVTGWNAWEIAHQVPGYAGLKPYSQR